MENFGGLLKQLQNQLKNIKNEKEAYAIKNIFFKKNISPLYIWLKNAKDEEKKILGKQINTFKQQIEDVFNAELHRILDTENATKHLNLIDLNIDTSYYYSGAFNPIEIMNQKIIKFFEKFDFDIVHGNEVVDTKYNFDYLNFDEDHPGRLTSESFYFDQHTMLRAHNTASTAEQMHLHNKSKDLRILTWGSVYRNDDDDLSHSHQFNQIDIVWIKEGLNVSNLKWIMTALLQYLYGKDVKIRFRLSYFVFTEPSFEVDIQCPVCHGKGCSLCKKSGWIEILGAGMLHQNVLKSAGFKINSGIAAGIGIDRLAMIKYGINDIRDIYSNDFRFINQFAKEN